MDTDYFLLSLDPDLNILRRKQSREVADMELHALEVDPLDDTLFLGGEKNQKFLLVKEVEGCL